MTKQRWRIAGIAAGCALCVYLVVGIVLAGRDRVPIPQANAPIVLQGGNVRGGTHTISTRSWTLSYDRGRFSPDGVVGSLDGVHDGIIYRKGKPYIRLDAKHVELNAQTLDFTAVGRVHIAMLDDPYRRSFDTDLVTWTNDAKLLQMEHTSYLHVGGQTLRIATITVDFSKNEVHLGALSGAVGIP
ncbi:MAG: hypothetical protein ACREMP_03185 [Candidatus Tyrphobacter sp.]